MMWKGVGLSSPLEVASARVDGACNSGGRCNNNDCLPFGVYPCAQQSVTIAQILNIWRIESFLLTLASPGCVQAIPERGVQMLVTWLGVGDG